MATKKKTVAKPRARKPKVTDEQILESFELNGGSWEAVRKALGITEIQLNKRLEKQPLKEKYWGVVLYMSRGNVAIAASRLGITREHLSRETSARPLLKTAKIEGKESRIDWVESKLDKRIDKEDTTAIIFFLKTQAKHRGYVERQEMVGADGEPIQVNLNMSFKKPAKKKRKP